jgi:hypothetical protein
MAAAFAAAFFFALPDRHRCCAATIRAPAVI